MDRSSTRLMMISIHAPREGRDRAGRVHRVFPAEISIHAPREGRDSYAIRIQGDSMISIHAPREGRDNAGRMDSYAAAEFQSTRPARGATG